MLPLKGSGLWFPERNGRSETRQMERASLPDQHWNVPEHLLCPNDMRATRRCSPGRGEDAPPRPARPAPHRCEVPSSTPLRTSFSSSSVQSQRCSFQLSPFSLRSTTSSRSFPRSAAKCGISTITGLARQGMTLSAGGRYQRRD